MADAWLDVEGALTDEHRRAALALGFSPAALDAAAAGSDRPVRHAVGDELFVAVRPAGYDEAARVVTLHRLVVLVSSQAVLVRHAGGPGAEDLRAVLDRLPTARTDPTGVGGPRAGDVVAAVVTLVTDGYTEVLDAIEDDLADVESAVFGGRAEAPRRIYELSREVVALERATHPLLAVADPLPGTLTAGGDEEPPGPHLHAADQRAHRAAERVDVLRSALADILVVSLSLTAQEQNARAAELAEIGVRQNEQVKRISGWAAILVVPTLVTGVYGMNFAVMPELGWRYGYPVVLAGMALLSGALFLAFRRRGWL